MEQDKYFGLYIAGRLEDLQEADRNLGLRYEFRVRDDGALRPRSHRILQAARPTPLNDAARANYAKNPMPELPVSSFRGNGRTHLR